MSETTGAFPAPDLLDARAAVRVDAVALRRLLAFAFAVGGSIGEIERVTAACDLPPSTFRRASFERDLYLADLLDGAMAIRVGGLSFKSNKAFLMRAIGEPPASNEARGFRRSILNELATTPRVRADFERCFASFVGLRQLLCAERAGSERLRRLEILRAIHAAFGDLARSFEGATSGLSRLATFGAAVVDTDAYRRLDALLDHDANLATLDLRVRIGADGELRALQIVSIRENRESPFYATPFGRFLARLFFFFRGYRMNGGEVAERVYEDVFAGLEEALVHALTLVDTMQLYLASLALRDRAEAAGLAVGFAERAPREKGIAIDALFNPHLLRDGKKPVPCDLATSHASTLVVVTGPNSGGKTRLLQAIGIAELLGEGGLFVPARAARLPPCSGIFASLVGDERADQPEGHLGMELARIRHMFEDIEPGGVVLLDELCSGTNPSEGEEIARLVLELLGEVSSRIFVTTHLLDFAARLVEAPPSEHLEMRRVELDREDLPTYRFVEGVATSSLAQKTAARLGVTREELRALLAAKKPPPPSEDEPATESDDANDALVASPRASM